MRNQRSYKKCGGIEKIAIKGISNPLNGHRFLNVHPMNVDFCCKVEYCNLSMFLRFKGTQHAAQWSSG